APAAALEAELGRRSVLALEVPMPSVRPDAVGPHLRRLADKVARRLVDEGFKVKGMRQETLPSKRNLLLWEHEPRELPDVYEHRGPPVDDADNSRRFLQKWQGHADAVDLPHPSEGRWRVNVRRHERTANAILKGSVPQLLQGVDLPAAQRRKAKLTAPRELLRRAGARLALSQLLSPRDPWEN
ncbi:MAG TPA: hypothetical protein VI818_05105, partial [Candidatus Thermoplasmatota archaeon]|nr:hypothetical protein [Candidatus Thermoplasmatota archaeon]